MESVKQLKVTKVVFVLNKKKASLFFNSSLVCSIWNTILKDSLVFFLFFFYGILFVLTDSLHWNNHKLPPSEAWNSALSINKFKWKSTTTCHVLLYNNVSHQSLPRGVSVKFKRSNKKCNSNFKSDSLPPPLHPLFNSLHTDRDFAQRLLRRRGEFCHDLLSRISTAVKNWGRWLKPRKSPAIMLFLLK